LDTFRWISVIVSIILGLGVTRLLIGAVNVFRMRDRAVFYWPVLAWAAAIFAQQVAFWWSLEAASGVVTSWTFIAFLLLVGLVLALFLAATLILPFDRLPEGETLRTYFERDGRWALAALAVFNLLAILTNTEIWHEGLLTESARINLVLTIIPAAGFLGGRRVHMAAAIAYLVIVAWGIHDLSPLAY